MPAAIATRYHRRGGAVALAVCGAAAPAAVTFLSAGLRSTGVARSPAAAAVAPATSDLAAGAWRTGDDIAFASSSAHKTHAAVAAVLAAGATATARRVPKATGRKATNIGGSGSPEDAVPFEIRGFSLASSTLLLGLFLMAFSVLDYTVLSAAGTGFGLGGITFIYAVPVIVLGGALAYAELQPVEVETEPDAEGLFDKLATTTLNKIKSDVTRHRYGDDAHLDSSLKALGLTGTGRYPQLKKIIESKAEGGELQFTMIFESKDVPFTTWADPMKIRACDRFFGPGLWSEIWKYSSENKQAALRLTTGAKPGTDTKEKDQQIKA